MALSRAFGDEVADHDHDHAGRDADARLQRLPRRRLQPSACRRDGQARAYCTLGIVLMRTRPAKVSEHAITEELRNGALKAQDLAGHRVLIISPDQRTLP